MLISVVVPTFKRPSYLRSALDSLMVQERLPDEVVVVTRDDDLETHQMIQKYITNAGPKLIPQVVEISDPGFVAPIRAGITAATGEIVAFMDDDARAHADWLLKLESAYSDGIGGVGGRCVDFKNNQKVDYAPSDSFSEITWYGRFVGNMYRDSVSQEIVDANFVMGGNMSFRRSLLERVNWEPRLEQDVSFYWEIDLGLQVKRMGYQLLYHPSARVDHFNAPRAIEGMRTTNWEGVFWSSHNALMILRRHFSWPHVIANLFYTFLIGNSATPGVVYVCYQLVRNRPVAWREHVMASVAGRLKALQQKVD